MFLRSKIVPNPYLHHALWDLKIIWHKWSSRQDGVLGIRIMSLGQRSRSQSALKVCVFQINVRPITSSCTVGFDNYLEEMTITKRRCVACKNHVARSKDKVTAAGTLSLCIPDSCPTHNFIPKIVGVWKLLGRNDHQDKTMCLVLERCR